MSTASDISLFVDEGRVDDVGTGLFVRAVRNGKHDTYEISQLTPESLLIWLRSRGGDNPWAEDVVGILLGHGHLHNTADEQVEEPA